MDITDYQSFFAYVREINEKYLKPVDINIRIIEEYRRNSVIISVLKLKDMYGYLLEAIEPGDIVSGKGKIEGALQIYKNKLQIVLIRTQWALIHDRKNDLLDIIGKEKAAQIETEIATRIEIINEIIHKRKNITDCLDSLIQCSTIMQTLVENWYKDNHLD